MAPIILSPLLDAIIGSLSSAAMDDLRRMLGVKGELQDLKSKLSAIQAVLEDAEERQWDCKPVMDWLQKLQDVSYDADDLVDEIATEALQSKSESGVVVGEKRKRFWDYLPSLLNYSSRQREMACRIRDINEQLEKIAKEKADLHLQTRYGSKHSEIRERRQQLVGSVRDDSEVFGRQKDREQIIQSLLSDDCGTRRNFSVVAIVGMGGQGKTTVSQLVYNDDRVIAEFEIRAWVCVSDDFDVLRLTKEIIESASGNACDLSNFDALQRRLQDLLTGKRFLLVLDDIWNENFSYWEKLQSPFTFGAKGSKIVATTRSRTVSDLMQPTCTYNLEGLSKKDCWALFTSRAFADDGDDINAFPHLIEIGRKLVDRCKGSPLAAKALGGLLSSTRDTRAWRNILNSSMWELHGAAAEILPALRLSYHHLPAHLKRCFTFCSIYQKGIVFAKEKLVSMWIAHGFVHPRDGELIEDTGSRCFNDLVLRSFFQYSSTVGNYTMHDLFHDLAQSISGTECMYIDDFEKHGIPKRTRHVSLNPIGGDDHANFRALYESEGLRTLLLKGFKCTKALLDEMFNRLRFFRVLELISYDIPECIGNLRHLRYLSLQSHSIKELTESICSLCNLQTLILIRCYELVKLPESIDNLKCLRYLKLDRCHLIIELPESICSIPNLQTLNLFHCRELVKLPDSIGHLRHLRCLSLEGCCVIKELPESICSIYSLQTLNLFHCHKLAELPNEMSKLINLQHVILGESFHLQSMPPGIGRLTCLQTLSLFIIGREKGTSIAEIEKLADLHGNLEIRNVENVAGAEAALQANLRSKRFIDKLVLRWNSCLNPGSADEKLEEEVAAGLQPHPNIKKLSIVRYMGTCFPSWMMRWDTDEVVPNLTTLVLDSCRRCSILPPVGQLPSLVDLTVSRMDKLEQIEEGGFLRLRHLKVHSCPLLISLPCFPSLNELHLLSLDNLGEWCSVGKADFRNLHKLSIHRCPKMTKWPNNLSSLTELSVSYCHGFDAFPLIPSICRLRVKESSNGLLNSVSSLTSLSFLTIDFLKLTAVPQGILQALTQLKKLVIFGCDKLVGLLEEDGLQNGGISSTLTHLSFRRCLDLKSLPRGLYAFISLHSLSVYNCPEVTALPDKGLPAGLQCLTIHGCPRLVERCRKDTGEDWPKISHVRNVWFH